MRASQAAAFALAVADGLDHGNVNPALDLGLGIGVHLPRGLHLVAEKKPATPPPSGSTNVWHPAHAGVDIDGCDNQGAHDWHWVHPCGDNCNQRQPPYQWTTRTVTATSTHAAISCAPTITPCPAGGNHTAVTTVVTVVTVIPAAASTRTGPAPAAAHPRAASSAVVKTMKTKTISASTSAPASSSPGGADSVSTATSSPTGNGDDGAKSNAARIVFLTAMLSCGVVLCVAVLLFEYKRKLDVE